MSLKFKSLVLFIRIVVKYCVNTNSFFFQSSAKCRGNPGRDLRLRGERNLVPTFLRLFDRQLVTGRVLGNSKKYKFLIGCPVTTFIVSPQKSCGTRISGCVFLGESVNGFVILDHSDAAASKEPTNPLWHTLSSSESFLETAGQTISFPEIFHCKLGRGGKRP